MAGLWSRASRRVAAAAVAFPFAATAAESPAASFTVDELRPTLSTSNGRFTVSLRARLQIDAGGFDQSADVETVTTLRDVEFKHLDSGAHVRRAYLGIEGRAFRDLWYEFRMDFGGSGFALADPFVNLARLSYNWRTPDGPLIRVNAGLIKPIFTYSDSTSSSALTFLERAAAVNVATRAFGGSRPRLGAELTFQETDLLGSGDNLVVSAAFTGHIASRRESELPEDATGDGTHILGRIAYRLWSDDISNVQIGGSVARKLAVGDAAPGTARSMTLEDRPEIRVDGNSLISTGPIQAQGGGVGGLEAAANLRNVYLAAEYYRFGIDRDTECIACIVASDPEFSGWYLEASWLLTGEARTYQTNAMNNGMAIYANPRVASPFTLGGWGAWEIAARYSRLDLNWQAGTLGTPCSAGCVRGGEQKIWSIGLNWYLSNNFRVLLDYMRVDVDKLNASGAQIGQTFSVIGTRLQFTN